MHSYKSLWIEVFTEGHMLNVVIEDLFENCRNKLSLCIHWSALSIWKKKNAVDLFEMWCILRHSPFHNLTKIFTMTTTFLSINNQFCWRNELNTYDSAEHINYTVLMLCKQYPTHEIWETNFFYFISSINCREAKAKSKIMLGENTPKIKAHKTNEQIKALQPFLH